MANPERPNFEPLPLPDLPGLLGGWGEKLEKTLLRFVLSTFNTIMGPIWEIRDNALRYLFDQIEDELQPVIQPMLDAIDDSPHAPAWVRGMTSHLRTSEPITFAAIAASLIMASIMGLAMGLISPIQRLVSQEVDSYVHSARMTPQEAFAALRRGAITLSDYHNHLSDGGWSEELEEAWKVLLAPLVGVGDVTALYLRGDLTEGQLNVELEKRGYEAPEVTKIKTLLEVIPPLTDIIRMAVREAFTPEAVTQFQLHAELPTELVEWAAKQGLSEEWSRAYWAAHWELPSLTLGYEMYHRREITEAELKMLIKAHDVSPFWRDKLISISYNPYTRVDIRRMHAMGVVSVEEVYENYRDIGYNHERATKMTEFTVAYNQTTERDLTKTEILYGYEHGFFSPAETDDLLLGLGYDQAEADYYKAKVDYKRWQNLVKETVKYVSQQYIANQITEAQVYAQLGALNLPATQINRYIRQWDLKKQAKTKRLTADRLLKFRTQDVITDQEFTDEMSGLGYSQKYIEWYLSSLVD